MRSRHVAAATLSVGVAALIATGCGTDENVSGDSAATGGGGPKVALIVSGNLGDGNFFDQANAGVKEAAKELGVTPQIIETGPDPTKWGPALEDAAAGDAEVIIAGSFAMKELVEQAAAAHPDKQFVLFDVEADVKACGGCTNIYSIVYRYREAGFLAGALAALHMESEAAGDAAIGFVGGEDIPVIQDFKEGWQAGAAEVAPDVERISAFAGSFNDPVKGKQIAGNIVSRGAGVLFAAAGATNAGVFEAAAAERALAIGVSDAEANDAEVGGRTTVLTSATTNVKGSLADAVRLAAEDKLPTGETRSFGVEDGAIHLVDTPTYHKHAAPQVRERMQEISEQLASGAFDAALAG
jgi:basic membrane protein A